MKGGRRLFRLLVVALLAGGCWKPALHPEAMDAEALRAHMLANFAPLERLEVEWTALLEAPGVGAAPFRMDVDWSADGVVMVLKTPFGGELATLRASADGELGGRGGSRLKKNVDRALEKVEDGRLRGWLESGARALFRYGDRPGFRMTLKDEALAPLLAMIEPQIPGGWLQAGRSDRKALGPWLWGEWLPPAEAAWRPADLEWASGDSLWHVDERRGLVDRAVLDGLEVGLSDWSRQQRVWLPGRIEILDRGAKRRLILERRDWRLNRPRGEDEE